MWALPGGFLEIDEDLETCAKRELGEETGIHDVNLEQLATFGHPNRDPRERIISIAYYALAHPKPLRARAGSDARELCWFPLKKLPQLAFDHARIIALAYQRLVAKLDYADILFQIMPETFTLSELQSYYEIILNRRLDKRSLRKRLLAQNLIHATGRYTFSGKHRLARLYRARNPQRVIPLK
jgi:8-oxo-dGTP diphosphatase